LDREDNVPKQNFKQYIETAIIIEGKALSPNGTNLSVEARVDDYFDDIPLLKKIAWCESKFKHYTDSGNILRGEITPSDIGVMQINEYFHKDTADRLGYDIYTLEGNISYARWLYKREGSLPWSPSMKCWNKELARK